MNWGVQPPTLPRQFQPWLQARRLIAHGLTKRGCRFKIRTEGKLGSRPVLWGITLLLKFEPKSVFLIKINKIPIWVALSPKPPLGQELVPGTRCRGDFYPQTPQQRSRPFHFPGSSEDRIARVWHCCSVGFLLTRSESSLIVSRGDILDKKEMEIVESICADCDCMYCGLYKDKWTTLNFSCIV